MQHCEEQAMQTLEQLRVFRGLFARGHRTGFSDLRLLPRRHNALW